MNDISQLARKAIHQLAPDLADLLSELEVDPAGELAEIITNHEEYEGMLENLKMREFCFTYKTFLSTCISFINTHHVSDRAEELANLQEAIRVVDSFVRNLGTAEVAKCLWTNSPSHSNKVMEELIDAVLFGNILKKSERIRLEIGRIPLESTSIRQHKLIQYHRKFRPSFPSLMHHNDGPGKATATNRSLECTFKLSVGMMEYLLDEIHSCQGQPVTMQPMMIVIEYNELFDCDERTLQDKDRKDFSFCHQNRLEFIALDNSVESFAEFVKHGFGGVVRGTHNIHYLDMSKARFDRTRCLLYYHANSIPWPELVNEFAWPEDDEFGMVHDLLNDPSKILLSAHPSIDGRGLQFYIQMCGNRSRCHCVRDLQIFFQNVQSLLGLAPKPFWKDITCRHRKDECLKDETFQWCRELVNRGLGN